MDELQKCEEAFKVTLQLRRLVKEFKHESSWLERKFPSFGGAFIHKAIINIERELSYIESCVKVAHQIATAKVSQE